jgi:hypothetical protein
MNSTATTPLAVIPAAEHGVGFTAVTVRFPDGDPAAHRITRLYHRPDGTLGGMPSGFDGKNKSTTEIRPACRPDTDPASRFYELSVPTALARGAVACDLPQCYGGAA